MSSHVRFSRGLRLIFRLVRQAWRCRLVGERRRPRGTPHFPGTPTTALPTGRRLLSGGAAHCSGLKAGPEACGRRG